MYSSSLSLDAIAPLQEFADERANFVVLQVLSNCNSKYSQILGEAQRRPSSTLDCAAALAVHELLILALAFDHVSPLTSLRLRHCSLRSIEKALADARAVAMNQTQLRSGSPEQKGSGLFSFRLGFMAAGATPLAPGRRAHTLREQTRPGRRVGGTASRLARSGSGD